MDRQRLILGHLHVQFRQRLLAAPRAIQARAPRIPPKRRARPRSRHWEWTGRSSNGELGAIVTATDSSAAMLERARARTTAEEGERVTYRLLNVTKEEEFELFIAHAKEVRLSFLHADD
jgi:hypothetical protein